jgi:hypothetical protein
MMSLLVICNSHSSFGDSLQASDTNRDGKISYPEFLAAFRQQTAKSLMEIIDPDALQFT